MPVLKTCMGRARSLSFVKRIFGFAFLLSQFLDFASDVPALAECVRLGFRVPEGYELLINYMANTC